MLYLCTTFCGDSLAQQVEHIPFKDGVVGSSPTRITQQTQLHDAVRLRFFLSLRRLDCGNYFLYLPMYDDKKTNVSHMVDDGGCAGSDRANAC